MEAAWVTRSDETEFDQIRTWRENWERSVSDNFRAGVDVVRGYQMRRQTIYEVLIISLLVGVLGNILAQALFPYPMILQNSSSTQSPSNLPIIGGIVLIMIVFVGIYLWNQGRYGPKQPAETSLTLDYPTLLKSYNKETRDDIEYLMGGAGVRDFEDLGRRVLKRTLDHLQAIALGCEIPDVTYDVRHYERSPPHVSMSVDLKEVARANKMLEVHSKLVLLLYPSRFSENPNRANGVNLRVTVTITNPYTPLADDFLTQVIEPLLPWIAETFSVSFWTELLALSPIPELRQLIKRVHDYNVRNGKRNDWYLMNRYPFDGKSKIITVIDRHLVAKELITDSLTPDPLLKVLDELGLLGCYVTDSAHWISPVENRKLFGGSSHLEDELICIRPAKVISIGHKSKRYVSRTLRNWASDKPGVIYVLGTRRKVVDRARLEELLRTNLKKALPVS